MIDLSDLAANVLMFCVLCENSGESVNHLFFDF